MNPAEWENAAGVAVDWRKAYPAIADECRRLLRGLPEDRLLTTNELVQLAYPIETVRGTMKTRDRVYTVLLKCKNSDGSHIYLDDCRVRGPVKKLNGGVKAQTWLWRRPKRRMICCPNCQHEWEA